MRSVEGPRHQIVERVVVNPDQPFRPVRIAEDPAREALLDPLLLFQRGDGLLLVDDPLRVAVGVAEFVVDFRRAEVQRLLKQQQAGDAPGSEFLGVCDRAFGVAVAGDGPERVFRQVVNLNRAPADAEQAGGKVADNIDRDPRRAKVGVDVAGKDVLRLNRLKRLDVALDPGLPRGCQLPPHVPGQVGIAGFIGAGFGVEEHELAQLGQDRVAVLAIQGGDVVEIDPAALIERNQQSFLGRRNRRDRGGRPDHILHHDRRFRGLPRCFVIFLKGHDQEGVGVFPEPDQVRHAPDLVPLRVQGKGRPVDRPVERHEGVIGPVQPPAGVPARNPPAIPHSGKAAPRGRGRAAR